MRQHQLAIQARRIDASFSQIFGTALDDFQDCHRAEIIEHSRRNNRAFHPAPEIASSNIVNAKSNSAFEMVSAGVKVRILPIVTLKLRPFDRQRYMTASASATALSIVSTFRTNSMPM